MTHDFIAAHDVIARYVTDRLAADEERDFEAHLIDCAQCSGGVEQELALRDGLAASATARPITPKPAIPVQRSNTRWWQAAAAVLAMVASGLALSLALTRSALKSEGSARADQQQQINDLRARVADRSPEPSRAPTDRLLPTI